MLKLKQAVKPGEVNRIYELFLSFVKTSNVRMCRVTVSVLSGGLILRRSQVLVQTFWLKGVTDKWVMEGREIKRALQAM